MAKSSTTKNGFSPKSSRKKRPGVIAKSKTAL